eukprot:144773_1
MQRNMTQQGCGTINVEEWLKSHKLSNVYDLFKSKSITIEEISELDNCDIDSFAQETLQLDVLSKKRFIDAITKIKQKNQLQESTHRHVVISPKEQAALTKLYERYNECSKQQILIQNSLHIDENENNLHKYYTKSVNDINNIFDEIIKQLMHSKNKLLQNIDDITNTKQQQLTHQLKTLQNQYIPLINNGINKIELYQTGVNKQINIVKFINNILSFNNNPCSTIVFITQPNIQFHNYLQPCNAFLNEIKIDDCDKPLTPQMKIIKVEANYIYVQYDINKPYYYAMNKPILKVCIEYALIKYDEYLWSDYKATEDNEENDTDSSSSDSDSDSE